MKTIAYCMTCVCYTTTITGQCGACGSELVERDPVEVWEEIERVYQAESQEEAA